MNEIITRKIKKKNRRKEMKNNEITIKVKLDNDSLDNVTQKLEELKKLLLEIQELGIRVEIG